MSDGATYAFGPDGGVTKALDDLLAHRAIDFFGLRDPKAGPTRVPMEARVFVDWTPEEIAEHAAEYVADLVPEEMSGDRLFSSPEFDADFGSDFDERDMEAITAALVPWARRQNPGLLRELEQTRKLTPGDWLKAGLVVDENGNVLAVVG